MARADIAYAQTISLPSSASSKGYYAWVDYAKGVGIILVVLGHVLRGIVKAGIVPKSNSLVVVDSIIYSFHMPLFFFISGLFFHNSLKKRHSDGLIKNKFDTIIYPYIIWSLIQSGIEIALSRYTNNHFNPAEVLSIIWTPRDQFWFLYILMMCFVIFIIIESSFEKINYFIVTAILSLLYTVRDKLNAPFIFDLFLANAVYFSLGILCGKSLSSFEEICKKYTIPLMIIAACSQYIFHFLCNFNYTKVGFWSLALAIVTILFFIGLSINSEHRFNLIKVIGKNSMPIYLIHIITGSGARIVLHSIFHINDLYVQAVFGTIMGIFCPIIIHRYANTFGMSALFIMPRSRKSYLTPSSAK